MKKRVAKKGKKEAASKTGPVQRGKHQFLRVVTDSILGRAVITDISLVSCRTSEPLTDRLEEQLVVRYMRIK